MHTALTSRGYTIKKSDLTQVQLESTQKALTVSPYIPGDYAAPPEFELFLEGPTKLYLPKTYGLTTFGIPLKNKLPTGEDISVKFEGTLRPEQEMPVKAFMKASTNPTQMGGILSLPCAFGKTTIAIHLICRLAKKTMIIVHKDFLLQQWIERITQFAPSARVGTIKAKIVDVENKDIVMASLQSLSMKEYDPAIFEGFGFGIIDECFPYKQKIATDKGPTSIGFLYKLWNNKQPLPQVLSFNEFTQKTEYKNITHGWKKTNPDLLEFTFLGGDQTKQTKQTMQCTANHKILTPKGYMEAMQLTVGNLVTCNTYNTYNNGIGANCTTTMSIQNIRPIKNASNDVFDIEVEDNHNFIACGLSGIGPIVHNCHHMGAEVFSKALQKINFQYSLGLSATVNRKDGLTNVFKWHIGEIVYAVKRRVTEEVRVSIEEFYAADQAYSEHAVMYNSKPNMPKMINNICNYMPRVHHIIQLIQTLVSKEPLRKILLLSDRRGHLERFQLELNQLNMNCGLYYGGMKQEALKENEGRQVILGTYAIASEGLDISGLNTLILASPKSDVIQSVGRILRDKPDKRQCVPLIIDIVDQFSMFPKQAEKRQKYYKKCKYVIEGLATPSKCDTLIKGFALSSLE